MVYYINMPLSRIEEAEYIQLYTNLIDNENRSLSAHRRINELQHKNKSSTKFCSNALDFYKKIKKMRNKQIKKKISDISYEIVSNVFDCNISESEKEAILDKLDQIMAHVHKFD